MTSDTSVQIIDKAKEMGASMAGIANVEFLKKSPSHEIIKKLGMEIDGVSFGLEMTDFNEIKWPEKAQSALVIAVSHPRDKPELDWWDAFNSSPGNRILVRINRELSEWIEETLGIKTQKMPYSIENGGICLKDMAVLGGLGCIGKNNLLVTPQLGSRLRLRAMLLEDKLNPTGPIVFDPCDGCVEFCRKACPQNAYEKIVFSSIDLGITSLPGRKGCFSRSKCMTQVDIDIERSEMNVNEIVGLGDDLEKVSETKECVEYCRRCELACPVGS